MAFSAIRGVSRRSASPDRMAAVTSARSRSRSVTGDGTSGGNALGVGGEPALTFGRSRPSGRSALRRSGVLLALGFLALVLHAGLLVVLPPASLGKDSRLLDLLVEATQGALERLVFANSDFCQPP